MITYDLIRNSLFLVCRLLFVADIVTSVTKKDFLAFRVRPELRLEIQRIADSEARSVSQVCELLLTEGVEAYKKDGPKFMQRLVAKQKSK